MDLLSATSNVMILLTLLELGKYVVLMRTKREREILRWPGIMLFLWRRKLIA